jgi:hypothetical protein
MGMVWSKPIKGNMTPSEYSDRSESVPVCIRFNFNGTFPGGSLLQEASLPIDRRLADVRS